MSIRYIFMIRIYLLIYFKFTEIMINLFFSCFAAFLFYAALVIAAVFTIISHYIPQYGQTHIICYVGVCSLVGSLGVGRYKIPFPWFILIFFSSSEGDVIGYIGFCSCGGSLGIDTFCISFFSHFITYRNYYSSPDFSKNSYR